MGRTFSVVTVWALEMSSTGATQMLRTLSTGAWKLIHLPSGLSRAWARCGFPNRTSRGIRGASARFFGVLVSPAELAGVVEPTELTELVAGFEQPRAKMPRLKSGTAK